MGKKERRKSSNVKTPHSNKLVEQSNRNAILIEPLLARFDTPNADFFALVTQSVDRHRLRVFDTHAGTVINDFSSESEEKFNCLTWGKIDLNKKVDTPSPKKKKKLSPINDFIFTKDCKKGYSCGEDMNIVEWNIDNESAISKWNVGPQMTKCKLGLSHDETKLLSVGHSIIMWDLQSKQIFKTFTGHATRITNIMFSAKDELFITSAEHDRFINIWKCQDSGNLDALTLDENITNLSISKMNTVLAVSEAGVLYIFKDITSSLSTDTTLQNKRKKRFTTHKAEGQIKFLNEDGADIIPILSACFVENEEDKEMGCVMVARGSTVKPAFEKVQFTYKNVDTPFQDIILKRHQPTGFLMNDSDLAARNLQETQKLYDDSKVKVTGTTNYELPNITAPENEGLEDINKIEIKDLNTVDDENNSNQKPEAEQHKFKKFTGHSVQQMLVQALHSNDKQLILVVFEQTDPDIINNTVKKLPTKYIVPFLEKAITRFQEKPNAGAHILQWIKAVLLFHMTYLMTIPDLTRKLSNFYQTLDARVMVFQKLLNFYGRLDLVMQQVSMHQQDVINTSNDPILSYIESSDENEDDESDDDDEDEAKDSGTEETDEEHEVFINRDLDNGHLEEDENESEDEDEDEEMIDAVKGNDDDYNDGESNIGNEEIVEELEKDNLNDNKGNDSEDNNEDERDAVNNYMDIDYGNNNEDNEDDNEGDETGDNDENDDDDDNDEIEANDDDDDEEE